MRTQTFMLVASLIGAACTGASQPRTTAPPIVIDPRPSPPPDEPPPVIDVSCKQQPPLDDGPAWTQWTLRCEPIVPANPIEGENVEAIIPYPPGGHGPCTAGEISFDKVNEGDTTLIRVEHGGTGYCENVGLSVLTLGTLPVGQYRLDTGYYQTSFVVRPTGSDPGDLDETFRLQIEVARTHSPGTCFGMPGGDMFPGQSAFAQSRTANQMKKAFPALTIEELEALYGRATLIGITASASSDTWTYGYSDGHCCIISEVQGTITANSDGTFSVSPGNVVSSHSEPC